MSKRILSIVSMLIIVFSLVACGDQTVVNTDVPNYIKKQSTVYSTNLDGLSITPYSPGKDSKIIFANGKEEKIGKDYIALFVNGTLIENAGVFIENDRIVAPVALVTRNLHLGTEWNVITRKLTVFDDSKIIEVFLDDKQVKIGDELIELEMYPEIKNDRLYASSEFFKKALNVNVVYYNGNDESGVKIIPGFRQVMFSRYPENETIVTVDEAINFVKNDAIIAYEKKYSKFEPLPDGEKYDKNEEQEATRGGIRDLFVIDASDRFYRLHLINDILVDKFTGEVFTMVRDDEINIKHFNPYSENALKFK